MGNLFALYFGLAKVTFIELKCVKTDQMFTLMAASSRGCEPKWKECNMLRRTGTNALPVVWKGETKMMLFFYEIIETQ